MTAEVWTIEGNLPPNFIHQLAIGSMINSPKLPSVNLLQMLIRHANLNHTKCDQICKKVPFPHILHTSKQNDVTLDSLH